MVISSGSPSSSVSYLRANLYYYYRFFFSRARNDRMHLDKDLPIFFVFPGIPLRLAGAARLSS